MKAYRILFFEIEKQGNRETWSLGGFSFKRGKLINR